MGFWHSVCGAWNGFQGRKDTLVLAIASVIACSPASAAEGPRRIFLLEGLTPTQPAAAQTMDAFKQRLKERNAKNIEVYTDFLDLGRFRGPRADARMAEFLREKFAQEPPDLIVPISRGATTFTARHRNEIARGIPVVYCCTPTTTTENLDIPPDMPGIVVKYDWAGTLALAQRLQPNAKDLVIVSGASEIDRVWQQEAIQSLQPFLKKYHTKYLAGLRHDEALKEVSRLPSNTIVILMPVLGDDGRLGSPTEGVTEIAKASSAPTYSPVATMFGGGIVGGNMDSYIGQGIMVADFALDILSGRDPSTLPHQTRLPLRYRVDARQLKRWGLREASLPPGASVEFREPTLWEQYRKTIVFVLLAFAAQAGVIALLLFQRHKRWSAEKLLKESEDRMAFAAASTNIGLWRFDVASGRLWATEHCRQMFGIGAEVPLSWDLFLDTVHPDDRHALDECLQAPALIGHPMSGEFRVLRTGDGPRWYMFRHYTVSDESGTPLQVSGIFTDVTERKNAEAQAELQSKEITHMMRVAAMGELSGGIAHELSQPLAAILANAQAAQRLLAAKYYNRQEIAEILDDIVQEDTRAGQVIHRLRRLLKKGEHESALMDLNEKVTSTLELLHSEVVNRKIKVEMHLKPDLPLISGDQVQLQQVLLNLIMNAMEAMASTPPLKRTLVIGTRTTAEGFVEVSISDHGPGMSPDELKGIFQPFFTTKKHGLGLGLSICSTIVTSHRGRLNLSNAKGGGATATVSLPLAATMAIAS
jgi:PAS domain S-box-containing protein